MSYRVFGIVFLLLGMLTSCRQSADTVFYNAKVYTLDEAFSITEAFAVKEGKIVVLGSSEKILEKYKDCADKRDLKGQFVYPGFYDAHCHFTGHAYVSNEYKLYGINSWQKILDSIKKCKPNRGTWLLARGWDQNIWSNAVYPDNAVLNTIFGRTPVVLKRVDGHALICNDIVLEMAGIQATSRIEGGQVIVKNNKATGVLVDNAMSLVERLIPEIEQAEALSLFQSTEKECLQNGVTSILDCGIEWKDYRLLVAAHLNQQLQMRTSVLLNCNEEQIKKATQAPEASQQVHLVGFKLYADGSLGSRGACLCHDYHDQAKHRGTMRLHNDSLAKFVELVYKTPYQLCTHAIGDSANRVVLKAYAKVLKGKNDRRWRIEHAQVIDSNDFVYFSRYNIIPSVQPTHAISDMSWAGNRLGSERLYFAYAYKQLLQTNGYLPLGTDFPVEPINPLRTFYAAVFRKNESGLPPGGFEYHNAINRSDALKGMTIWAARAAKEEAYKGSLERGKLADFVVLNRDIMQCRDSDILKTKVLSTYIGGVAVFE